MARNSFWGELPASTRMRSFCSLFKPLILEACEDDEWTFFKVVVLGLVMTLLLIIVLMTMPLDWPTAAMES